VNDVRISQGLVPDDVVDFAEQVVDHIVVGFELTATLSEVNICEVNHIYLSDVYLNDLSLLRVYPPLGQVFISVRWNTEQWQARALIVKKLTCDLEPPVLVTLAGCDFLLRITLVARFISYGSLDGCELEPPVSSR
jgi:hypothetical protein